MANTTEGAKTGQIDQEIDQEIEDLDREAREALDRLADKREELARSHRATELAEQRSRERAEERRRRDAEEAEREARERSKSRCEEIFAEIRELTAEIDGLAKRISEGLERREALDGQLLEEKARYDTETANRMARELPGKSRRWIQKKFGV